MSAATPSVVDERRLPAWVVDALLGVAVALIMSAVISADHGGRHDPDAVAYLWAIGLGSLMLVRRRHPVVVLAVTVLGLFAYYAAGYPAVGVAVPIAAALYSAAEFGRMRWSIGAALIALVTSVFFRLGDGQDLSLVLGYEFAGHVFLMAGAIALGDSIRSRRALEVRAREIVALTAERAQSEAEAGAAAQRVAIARDLHDSIGHATSVISLHADVAREAVGRHDHPVATEALHLIKDTASSSMVELRRTVSALRTPGPSSRDTASLADLRSLLGVHTGVRFATDVRLSDALPAAVDTTAYRIVQESVTNIVRHSTATSARIEAYCRDDVAHIAVTDDGDPNAPGPAAETGHGHGLEGMRERTAALGGTLVAGPEAGGFAVRATIPLRTQQGARS